MARATNSLPVPLSPETSTGVRVSFKPRDHSQHILNVCRDAPINPVEHRLPHLTRAQNSFSVTRRALLRHPLQ